MLGLKEIGITHWVIFEVQYVIQTLDTGNPLICNARTTPMMMLNNGLISIFI
jgi:hypothetical protein